MNFSKIKDAKGNKVWCVDYTTDGNTIETYGPETKKDCETWIRFNRSNISTGETFEVVKGPYKITVESESQVSSAEDLASRTVTVDKFFDLYNTGKVILNVPEGVDGEEFAKSVIKEFDNLRYEPSTNTVYDRTALAYEIEGNKLTVFVDKSE